MCPWLISSTNFSIAPQTKENVKVSFSLVVVCKIYSLHQCSKETRSRLNIPVCIYGCTDKQLKICLISHCEGGWIFAQQVICSSSFFFTLFFFRSCLAIFQPLGRHTWKKLIGQQASLQRNCNREGFNCKSFSKARIGIISNQENNCDSCDSRIGFGAGGYPIGDDNTCGNWARYGGDNGDRDIKAMGYILVQ